MSAAPTLEELAFWRDLVGQARATAEKPTQDNAGRLRKLGERAAKIRIPGFRRGREHMRLFAQLAAEARRYSADQAGRVRELADQVDAAIEAAIAAPHAGRKDLD